jgi:hypothetical protein
LRRDWRPLEVADDLIRQGHIKLDQATGVVYCTKEACRVRRVGEIMAMLELAARLQVAPVADGV